jgi:hypothetical protein
MLTARLEARADATLRETKAEITSQERMEAKVPIRSSSETFEPLCQIKRRVTEDWPS